MTSQKYKNILYETTDDGITTITLNRPEVFNAFNREMASELSDALSNFANEKDEWFCILTGSGKAFCSGEDLRNIDLDASDEEKREFTREALGSYHKIILQILESAKPIVAALNGTVAGAGLSIALACDERFAVEGDKNMLIPGFSGIGLTPDAGMVPLLGRLVGYQETKKWLAPGTHMTFSKVCEPRNAGEFQDFRIISALYFDMERMKFGINEFAHRLRRDRSLAEYCATKVLLNADMREKFLNGIFKMELKMQTLLEQGEDFREGLTAFREKRKPRFNRGLGVNGDDRSET